MPTAANRILLVDDDIELLNSLKNILSVYKFEVDLASSVNIALNKITENNYNLVISDIEMPKKSGLELLDQLKRIMLLDIPVILMTGHLEIDYAIEAIALGVDDFIKKPIESNTILKSINNLLIKSKIKEKKDKIDPNINAINWSFEFSPHDFLNQNIPDHILYLIKKSIYLPIKCINELSVCLEETITNAFIHGTLMIPDSIRQQSHGDYRSFINAQMKTDIANKKVFVNIDYCGKKKTLTFSVKDQGSGFNTQTIDANNTLMLDFSYSTGRGLNLVRILSNKITFLENGSRIIFEKKINEN
ncbi:MAG TPA: response regulator [Candidatus Cloacimonadota bacterium]|nr:response regulator [Candidatus Cloacimonadota bacterium]HQB41238.1 response regulator [Candidatus Cloacimonadota bacterium]